MPHLRRYSALVVLGACCGAMAGLASFVFLEALRRVTDLRIDHGWIVWLLPVAGLLIGFTYHRYGGRAVGGTALAVSEAHAYTRGAPARMAPLVLGGTLIGHLFGASIGREGTAVQMSSSLTDAGARALHLDHDQRATLARAALAGGFGAVFGVPFAGVVFAMEVARRRTLRAVLASVPAAFVGHWVVEALGYHHTERAAVTFGFSITVLGKLLVAGCVFGLAAALFTRIVPALRTFMAHTVAWPPARPLLGGLATLLLVVVVGRDYLGLSLPLLDTSLAGADIDWYDPALKLLFTVVALGSGFVGGEVTPLFVIGAALGSVVSVPLHLPAATVAALGMAAVFGAAAHVPLACSVMAVELFGAGLVAPALLVCLVARAVAAGDGLYDHPLTPGGAPSPGARADHESGRHST
jgi:H+/Cl- antiporter ClcA